MWFKNLQIYRLPPMMATAQIAEQLARGEFVKCPSNQPMSRGWVPPRNDGGWYTHKPAAQLATARC